MNLMQSGVWGELFITNFPSCVFRYKSDYHLWSDKELYWSREERKLMFSARATGSPQVDLIWCPWAICHPTKWNAQSSLCHGVSVSHSKWLGLLGKWSHPGSASLHQEQIPSTPYIVQRRLFWWGFGWVIPEIWLLKD